MRTGHDTISIRSAIAGFLLVVAILFGGGGSPAPMAELVVEAAALAAVVAWAWLGIRDRGYPRIEIDRPLLVLTALFVAIPLVQLVPLPPAIWHRFPGREVEQQALALVGAADAWMPLSVSPTRTLASLLSLVPPVAMLYFVSRLTRRDRSRLLGLLAILALLSVVVGVLQMMSGNANWLRFYEGGNGGFATGFQANRNAQSDLLIVSSMALSAWAVSSRRVMGSAQARIGVGVLVAVLWLGVVVTASRSGVALIAVAIVTCLALVLRWKRGTWRRAAIVSLGALSLIVVAGIVLHDNTRVKQTFARFDDLKDVRPEIWDDTWYAIGQNWPAGAGMGTFQPVFEAAERLEFVRPTYANRAHNDYLEYLLEAGLAGALLLVIGLVFAVYRIVRMLRRDENARMRSQALFVAGSLAALVLHSLIDYPMRSISLATIAGLMAGLLGKAEPGRSMSRRRSAGGVEG